MDTFFHSNATLIDENPLAAIHLSSDSFSGQANSITGKWPYYFGLPLLTTALYCFWNFVIRLYLLRRWYEKQGIKFVSKCYAVLGAEMRVTGLQQSNRSHDWLYTEKPTDLYGTMRGFSLQLYSTSAELSEELVGRTGKHVDRDTPALYSFGRLSPYALTFLPINKLRFRERKVSLTKGMRDNKRLFDIVERQALRALEKYKVSDGSGTRIGIRELLNDWTRQSSGEYIWGKNNIDRYVEAKDVDGTIKSLPFMTALNQTFTELRFYASRFWNRVCFPLAGLPLTKESRRLDWNIRRLRTACAEMMEHPEDQTVASLVQQMNGELGIGLELTRDDLVTATIAGLDTIKSTTMGSLYHLLEPKNLHWRKAIVDEINALEDKPGEMFTKLMHAPILNSFIHESLRYEPPGSLINNAAVRDFDLTINDNNYRIKSGTRVVTCIHALHQNENSWSKKFGKMAPLTEFDPNRFVEYGDKIVGSYSFMPFGKGPRRCPGQAAGIMMVKVFIRAFLRSNAHCKMSTPESQTEDISWFNIYSKATFDIVCCDDDDDDDDDDDGSSDAAKC